MKPVKIVFKGGEGEEEREIEGGELYHSPLYAYIKKSQ
jgi:hypothetical protein